MDNSDQKFDTFFNQQAAGQIPYCQNFLRIGWTDARRWGCR